MREKDLQKRITDMADRFGWRWWHVPAPMVKRGKEWVGAKQAAGLPDLILIHDDPPRMLMLELKADGGKLSEDQLAFLTMAKAVARDAISLEDVLHNGELLLEQKLDAEVRPPTPIIGVHAVWPEHEPIIEQILRSKQVA